MRDCIKRFEKPNLSKGRLFYYGKKEYFSRVAVYLVKMDIVFQGILSDERQWDTKSLSYRNIPFVNSDEIEANDTILRVFCEESVSSNILNDNIVDFIYTDIPEKKVIIYGAGYRGGLAFNSLSSGNYEILYFCDQSEEKQRNTYYEREVISPTELLSMKLDGIAVVVALDESIIESVASELEAQGLKECLLYRDPLEDIPNVMFADHFVRYLKRRVLDKGKKLILLGSSESLLQGERELAASNIQISYGISTKGANDAQDGKAEWFRAPFDLCYEDRDDIFVVYLGDDGDYLEQIAKETGIEEIYGTSARSTLHKIILDPNLGYNVKYGQEISINILSKVVSERQVTIGILGNSTSDLYYVPEKSWMSYLCDMALEHGISIKLLCGGVAGYNVAQETIKLMRDMIPLCPNMVVSYSRTNQFHRVQDNEGFIHPFTMSLYEAITHRMVKTRVYQYIPRIYDKDSVVSNAEHWMMQERIMHAICKEFGVVFHAFAQPNITEKKTYSSYDYELLECLDHSFLKRYHDTMGKISELVRGGAEKYPWCHDLSNIFDDCDGDVYIDYCHVTDRGNEIVAQRIFETIEDDLIRVWESIW